jgi:hypothetical protein
MSLLRWKGVHPEQFVAVELDELFPGQGQPPTIPVEAP